MFGLEIALLVGLAAVFTVVTLKLLAWARVVDWFRDRQQLKSRDRRNIGVVLQQKLANGDHKEIVGIWNTGTNELVDATNFQAKELDATLAAHHADNELLVIR